MYIGDAININKRPTSAFRFYYASPKVGDEVVKIASGVTASLDDYKIINMPSGTHLEIQENSDGSHVVVIASNEPTSSNAGVKFDSSKEEQKETSEGRHEAEKSDIENVSDIDISMVLNKKHANDFLFYDNKRFYLYPVKDRSN